MNKYVIFFGLMIVSTVMLAQRRMDPMDRAAKRADTMKRELSLDEVQYKSVKAINEDYANKQMRIWRDTTLSRESRHAQMRVLHQEKEAALKKVLTEDQHKKLVANRSAQKKMRHARMARHHSERAERMQKNLALTDEQTAKIKEIDKVFANKFRALRSDITLAREDSREKARKLMDEYRFQTKSVLTDEQLKKWESQKQERKKRKS